MLSGKRRNLIVMERNRDVRRVSMAVINGVSRKRHKITSIRDSHEKDGEMELQEIERGKKKNKGQDVSKRRRVVRDAVHHGRAGGRNKEVEMQTGGGDADCKDDSCEEDYEEEENRRTRHLNQMDRRRPGPLYNSQSQRRKLRTLRSSPALMTVSDEIIGVPIPRRTRSASTKRLHEYFNSESGGSGEDLSHRRLSPTALCPEGGDIVVPSSLGVCLKEKTLSFSKSTGPKICDPNFPSNSRHLSLIQDDEIEVAEALFDLLKQSRSSRKQEKLDSDSKNTAGGLKREKAGDDTFHVQNEQTMEVDTKRIMVDGVEQMKEKFPSNTAAAQKSISDGVVNKEETVDRKSESSPCTKVSVDDSVDSTGTKEKTKAMEADTIQETRFRIDLMAPLPLPSSPERDGLICTINNPKCPSHNVQMDDPSAVAMPEEEKMGRTGAEQESPNLYIVRPYLDIASSCGQSKPQQQGGKEQKNQLQSSSLPFPIATSGVLPNSGLVPSLRAFNPINGSARSSSAFQLPPFKLSKPRPKRCATHQYIARNICYHQQLTEKALWSGAAGPILCEAKTLNLNSMQPTQKLILENPSPVDFFPEGQNLTTKGTNGKDKRSEAVASLDYAMNRNRVLQQAPQQVPAGDLLCGPAFVLPPDDCQAAVAATNNRSGPPQSSAIIGNAYLSTNLDVELSVVSFNHLKFPSNEAPPHSSNIEMPPPRETQAPFMPFLNGYYSLPPFRIPQNQPLLSYPPVLVQSAPRDTSTSSDASSHKSQHGDQRTGVKLSDNSFFMPTVHSAQLEEQQHLLSHSSSKSDTDISRKSSVAVADSALSQSLNTNNVHNFLVPIPSTNFALFPPGKMSGGAIGNKHGDPQKQGSNSRVDVIPQAFSLSFGTNASPTPAINFSSMAQNSAIYQMLPDMARYGYQMAPTAQMMQQHKNSQVPEGKTAPGSNNTDDGQKVILGKPQTSGIQSLMGTSVFDGSSRTLNFLPILPVGGNQPFPSSSAAITSFDSVNPLNSRQNQNQNQQQLVHLQKQQMQLIGHNKEPTCVPGTFITSSVSNNNLVSSQISLHQNSSSISTQWHNLHRTRVPGVSSASATSSLVNIPQQQTRNSQGQAQISFRSGLASASAFQGQQSAPAPLLAVGSPSNSPALKNTEPSPNGPSQKSSPTCGRNVSPILSTCPSQLSELKY